ncbi:MAG TPA: heme lyase CcmF/NrfE family subunit [Gammaproteobacteria bacterium]
MIVELGHFALILAFCAALAQSVLPLCGVQLNRSDWAALAVPATRWQFVFLLLAFICLAYAFADKDFSVLYVAQNSNSLLPLHYRLSAVWGAHEGSLLLWALILAGWSTAVTFFSRALPFTFVARVLAILGLISIGFLMFMLFTSNPFERLLPAAAEGRDLNPLLQDFGLIVHPPLLYMGYVGLSVPFAFAIAGLLEGRIFSAWTRWTRPWTLVAWSFLTVGIALGSWWAYYELGWGGWWFWDPVENASFMPWLLTTALLHSLAVTEQRQSFQAWTLLLAIFAFSLSLLGTFLVRSGVLVSVHAFATDPARGIFILIFLGLVIGSALLLYAWRAGTLMSLGRFSLISRETALLFNNIFLVSACAIILLATLYPIIHDAMGLGSLSVGRPYFDLMFTLLMLPLVLLLGFGPVLRWKRDDLGPLFMRLYKTLLTALVLALAFVLLAFGPPSFGVALSICLAVWVIAGSIYTLKERLRNKTGGTRVRALLQQPRAYFGMLLAHIGVGVFIIGVSIATVYEQHADVRLEVGAAHELGDYRFVFTALDKIQGPNYAADRATMDIFKHGQPIARLHPEKRFYSNGGNPMTEAGIDAGLFRDLYVSLGEPVNARTWIMRVHYKPFIRWVWLGALLMACGGVLSALDRRYRKPAGEPVHVA